MFSYTLSHEIFSARLAKVALTFSSYSETDQGVTYRREEHCSEERKGGSWEPELKVVRSDSWLYLCAWEEEIHLKAKRKGERW